MMAPKKKISITRTSFVTYLRIFPTQTSHYRYVFSRDDDGVATVHNLESSAGYDPRTRRKVAFSWSCLSAFCAFSSAMDAEKST